LRAGNCAAVLSNISLEASRPRSESRSSPARSALQYTMRGVRPSACREYEAITKAQLLKPDLIVLEVAIPRLNGVEAAAKLRKLLPKTPIILFTLHGSLLKGAIPVR
jgi:CheY-like chemotaxis protein